MDHSGFSHLILPFFQPANSRGSLLPSYELWVTLHGGNGRWQQVQPRRIFGDCRGLLGLEVNFRESSC